MKKNISDQEISKILNEELTPIEASDLLKRRIDCRINQKMEEEKKESVIMKKFNPKKIAFIAAAFCVVSSATVYASTKVSSWFTSSGDDTDIVTEYVDHDKTEEAFGHGNLRIPETIGEYTFDRTCVETTQCKNEEFDTVDQFKSVSTTYKDKDGDHLIMSICRSENFARDERFLPTATGSAKGVKVEFDQNQYKWVPADYKPTKEDLEREEKGHFYISYGADEVSEQTLCSADWTEGDLTYSFCFMKDKAYTPDEVYAMAGEVLESE